MKKKTKKASGKKANKNGKPIPTKASAELVLKAEFIATRRKLASLTYEITRNTRLFAHTCSHVLDVLNAQSLQEILNLITYTPMAAETPTKAVVVLHDPEHEIRNLMTRRGDRPADSKSKIIFFDKMPKSVDALATPFKPSLGPYSQKRHNRFFTPEDGMNSVAVLSLRRGSTLNGFLVWGSADHTRYTRRHATDFMRFSSQVIAASIVNMINKERLRWVSITDPLTEWFNRRHMEHTLLEHLRHAASCRQSVSCILFDLDHFKKLNDQYGHHAGDRTLQEVTATARKNTRPTDICARYGGEEFVVVVPRTPLKQATEMAERIRRSIAESPFDILGTQISATASIGVSTIKPTKDTNWTLAKSRLLQTADKALYQAKNKGRNQVVALRCRNVISKARHRVA